MVANETEGWRKDIGEAMARKRTEASYSKKKKTKKRRKKRRKKRKKRKKTRN
jgi:hypothetical protein